MSDDEPPAGAEATVRAYYEDLRAGRGIADYFADGETVVKCGVFSRAADGDAVADALRSQTETTGGWHVESRDLRVTERDDHAWFADEVAMGWTDAERGIRFEFETRWSGTLERRGPGGDPDPTGEWRFVGMHVSTAEDR